MTISEYQDVLARCKFIETKVGRPAMVSMALPPGVHLSFTDGNNHWASCEICYEKPAYCYTGYRNRDTWFDDDCQAAAWIRRELDKFKLDDMTWISTIEWRTPGNNTPDDGALVMIERDFMGRGECDVVIGRYRDRKWIHGEYEIGKVRRWAPFPVIPEME